MNLKNYFRENFCLNSSFFFSIPNIFEILLRIDVRPSSEIDKVIKSDKWLNILHYELRPMFKLTPAAFEVHLSLAERKLFYIKSIN